MDASWLYIVAWIFSTSVLSIMAYVPVPSPLALAALQLAGWALASYLLGKKWLPLVVAQTVAGIVGLAAALLVALATYPPAGAGFTFDWLAASSYGMALSLGVWFTGLYRASDRPGFTAAYVDFRIGLILVATTTLVSTVLSGRGIDFLWAGLGGTPIWFFGWALGALAFGNREVVREEAGSTGGGTGAWSALLVVVIGAILLIGALGGALGGQNLIDLAQGVVSGILLSVGVIIYGIIYSALWLFSQLGLAPPPAPPDKKDDIPNTGPGLGLNGGQQANHPTQTTNVPLEYQGLVTWIAIIVIVLLALWIASRVLRQRKRRAGGDYTEERESLGGWRLLLKQLAARLRAWLARFFPAAASGQPTVEDDLAALRGKPEWSGTLTVRQIYARLQSLAARMGHPRSPQQTPVEYLSVLSGALPDLRPDFVDITAAYLEARYGPLPASAPTVQVANKAWRHAEPALRAAAKK